jgi:hypothetical protein
MAASNVNSDATIQASIAGSAIINTSSSFAPSLSLDQASRKLLLQDKPAEPLPPKQLACSHGSLSSLQMTGSMGAII